MALQMEEETATGTKIMTNNLCMCLAEKKGNDVNYDRYLSCHTHDSLVAQLI